MEILRLNACDPSALQAALPRVAAVVNCITGDADTIVSSARALFQSCAGMSPPPRIIHLSTMMVYGTATGTVDETTPLRGDWDAYSAAKTEVERMAGAYPAVVHLRPGIVYGPGNPIWTQGIAQWLCAGRLGDLGQAGLGYCNLVHVDDVVQAIMRALRLPGIEGEAFNLSLPAPPTWNDYFAQFAAALETPFVAVSHTRLQMELSLLAPPLKLAQILTSALRLPWQTPAPIRPWLLRLCGHPIRLDVRKAERVLGMQWIPLEAGLRQAADWVRAAATTDQGRKRAA